MLKELSVACAAAPVVLGSYAYAGYPALLALIARGKRRERYAATLEWPSVTVVVPVYNEERVIADTLRRLLEIDYPRHRLQILVVSDASTDGSDDIVRSYAEHGVELLRSPIRRGKTAGENAAGRVARGDIVVNIDATIRVPRHALRALVRAFADPDIGVASGRDVTIGSAAEKVNRGEGKYTDYEMRIRSLETAVHSIVGASGCFFAQRRELARLPFPEHLSRDFGSALVARRHGYRSVAVQDAVCFVPCASSLVTERRRKVRTMTRGIGTLWHMRSLLNPGRYGAFSWMLFSHKLCRWVVPLTVPVSIAGLATLSFLPGNDWTGTAARVSLGAMSVVAGLGWIGWRLSTRGSVPRWLAIPAFFGTSIVAGLQAWMQWLRGRQNPTWDPTPRADNASPVSAC